LSGLCHHIPGFQALLTDCRDVLVYGQSIKLFMFVDENHYSDSSFLKQYVQLTYWNKETQKEETTMLQEYGEFIKRCPLLTKLVKIKMAYLNYVKNYEMELKLREANAVKWSPFSPKEHLILALENGHVSPSEVMTDIKLIQQVLADFEWKGGMADRLLNQARDKKPAGDPSMSDCD